MSLSIIYLVADVAVVRGGQLEADATAQRSKFKASFHWLTTGKLDKTDMNPDSLNKGL